MPTLTTQSIGAIGAPLVSSPVAAQAARTVQNNLSPGAQKGQNQVKASSSATEAKPANKRSVQDEARTEGIFGEEESGGEQQESEGEAARSPPGNFSLIA
jgi:hypothetical protein